MNVVILADVRGDISLCGRLRGSVDFLLQPVHQMRIVFRQIRLERADYSCSVKIVVQLYWNDVVAKISTERVKDNSDNRNQFDCFGIPFRYKHHCHQYNDKLQDEKQRNLHS